MSRRKSPARRAEVGGLPLVKTRRAPLHDPVVDVVAQVVSERLHARVSVDDAFPRPHEILCDIIAGKDLLPDASSQLVAAIGGATAESAAGLEEQSAAFAPQGVAVHRPHRSGALREQLAHGPGRTHLAQARLVTEQRQIALVGVQRVSLWMRCQHDRVGQVRLA